MKKLFTLVAMALCAVGMSAQTVWNFSEWDQQTISSDYTKDGLTVKAITGKTVVIDGSNKTVDGVKYTNRLKLGGTGAADNRSLLFSVDGPCTIDIILCSSNSSDERTLNIYTDSYGGTLLSTMTAPAGDPIKETYNYTGEAGTIYLGSASSGLNMYAIYVSPIATDETVTISDFGYSTFASTKGLDLSEVDGLKAYTATFDAADNKLVLTEVTEVPANTGIILEGTAGETYTIPTADIGNSSVTSTLVAVTSNITVDGTKANYVLANVDGVPGFYKYTGTEIAAGHAYLELDSEVSDAKGFTLSFGEATAISNVKASTVNADNTYYNLNGQRVAAPAKGLYILNGKKVIIK